MQEKIIKLLIMYADAKMSEISETTEDFKKDVFDLHMELEEMASDFDLDYFKNVFPKLSKIIQDVYEEHYK